MDSPLRSLVIEEEGIDDQQHMTCDSVQPGDL